MEPLASRGPLRSAWKWLTAVVLVTLTFAWAPAALPGATGTVQAADNSNTILMYGPSLNNGASSLEVQAANQLGIPFHIAGSTEWAGMSQAQFAGYRAIVVGDNSCSPPTDSTTIANTAPTWNAAASGNVIVIGTDPVFHAYGSSDPTNPKFKLIKQGIAFAADTASSAGTGAYVSLGCSDPASFLSGFGNFTEANAGVCYNNSHIVATHPALNGLRDADLSNWGCSVHLVFSAWPAAFSVLTIARDGLQTYTAPDGTTGVPYMLARGAGLKVISSIDISPLTSTQPAGTPTTFTATINENSSPISGKTVSFTVVSGPDAGKTGTDVSASDGTAHFTLTGTAGTDVIQASYVNSVGRTVPSSNAQAVFTPDATAPTTTASLAGTAGSNGWYTGPVTVTLAAADPDDAVASTSYSVDSAAATAYSVPFSVSGDGVHTVSFFSKDSHGNVETAKTSTFNIDGTAPTITGAITKGTKGSNGWHTGPVTIHWSCSDATSLIASCPADTTLSTDGAAQSVSGTATDNAGNSSTATVDAINIDSQAPTLSGAPTTSPNSSGWYNGPVTVHWTCADASPGSGIAGSCPADSSLAGEGKAQTATQSVSDVAGLTTTATSTPPVNIDLTPPSTTISSIPAWTNADVTVSLSATDNLSGVDQTFYTVNGGPSQTGSSITFSAEGIYKLTYWSVDRAGNAETPHAAEVKIDKTAPVISHVQTPAANSAGWNNTDVNVSFSCTDPVSNGVSSGIASCIADGTSPASDHTTVSTEGTALKVGGTATDTATLNIDKTPPTINGAATTSPNANGWYNAPVTVHFTCADDRSGVASCANDVTLSHDGTAQSAPGSARDAAGNSTSTTVDGINIDQTAPVITADTGGYTPGPDNWTNLPVVVTFHCTDAGGSTVASLTDPVTLTSTGGGQHVTGTCTDKAGNSSSTTVTDINIDREYPSLSGYITGPPSNNLAWYNRPVVVHFTCSDTGGSGVVSCPADQPFSTDGVYNASASILDHAGNGAHAEVGPIKVDLTAPQTTASSVPTWSTGDLTVTLTPTDNLSGVAATHYTIDGGAMQTGTSIPFTSEGIHTLTYWSVDNADNVEAMHTIMVRIDKTPPTIAGNMDRAPGVTGWYNIATGAPTFTFTCSDLTSGVAPGSCPAPFTFSEGDGVTATVSAQDVAGNTGSFTTPAAFVDLTKPTITATAITADGKPYTAGTWTSQKVTVHFDCTDALSGVASCPADQTISTEGDGQQATGTAYDKANNSATGSFGPIRIDLSAPTAKAQVDPAPNAAQWNKDQPTIRLTAIDPKLADGHDGSGVASITYSATGAQTIASTTANSASTDVPISTEGTTTLTYFATDNTGNAGGPATVVVKYDKTGPTIIGKTDRSPNAAGWYNAPVKVSFTCDDLPHDTASGVASCSDPATLSSDGTNQSATGSAADVAGNAASATLDGINIDQSAPQSSTLVSPAPNSAGWNKDAPTVNVSTSDPKLADGSAGSGVASITYSATGAQTIPVTVVTGGTAAIPVTGEGTTTVRYFATDAAGNVEAAKTILVRYDKTAPLILGKPDRAANGTGWYNKPVTVSFTCDDQPTGTASGVADCAAPVTLSGDGAGQSAVGKATDVAGNSSSASVDKLNIDQQAPTITANATTADGKPYTSGSWTNQAVTVHFTCADQPGLSGIASCRADRTVSGEGSGQSVSGTATDNAGNSATATFSDVRIDKSAPATSAVTGPTPTTNGWNNTAPTVTLSAVDAKLASGQDGSGVASIIYSATGAQTIASTTVNGATAQVPLTTEGTTTISFFATDNVGNKEAAHTWVVKYDKTAPIISGSTDRAANSFGWYNAPVKVSFTCDDLVHGIASGVASCPNPTTLSQEGAGQSVSGTATDVAGNSGAATVGGINIDRTAPVITISGVSNGGNYNAKATPAISVSDALSGIDTQSIALDGQPFTGGTAVTAIGYHTLVVKAQDKAGNPSSQTITFLVYAFPTSGAFVLGDNTVAAALQTTPAPSVTFSGSQWAKSNDLSGGGAPNSFKGFASSVNGVPTCGGTWTADPGNSGGAPATVPSYMAVIVSSTITKSGSTISGDIKTIVIVKTQGNSGTGTIVASVCG